MDNSYWIAAKYAFVVGAAVAMGTAAVRGAATLVNRGATMASVIRSGRNSQIDGNENTINLDDSGPQG